MTPYQEQICEIYRQAVGEGIVSNKIEFAAAVGLNYTSLTAVMNGKSKASGKNSVARVIAWWTDQRKKSGADERYIEMIPESSGFNWIEFRREAALKILAAANACEEWDGVDKETLVSCSIDRADELVRQLIKREIRCVPVSEYKKIMELRKGEDRL